MFRCKYQIGDMFIANEEIIQIIYYDSYAHYYQVKYVFNGIGTWFLRAKDLDDFPRFDNSKDMAKLQHLQDMVKLAERAFKSAYENVVRETLANQ